MNMCRTIYPKNETLSIHFRPVVGIPQGIHSKKVVFMIHGLGGCPEQFKECSDHFIAHGFWTCRFPLPGHKSESYSSLLIPTSDYDEFCINIANHISDIHRVEPISIHFVGMSFGTAFVRRITDLLHQNQIQSSSIFISPFLKISGRLNHLKAEFVRWLDTSWYGITPLLLHLPVIKSRYTGIGVNGLPCLVIARAFDFADCSHKRPAASLPVMIIQPEYDRVVDSQAAALRYPSPDTQTIQLPDHPHQMLDSKRVPAASLKTLHTIILIATQSMGKQECIAPDPSNDRSLEVTLTYGAIAGMTFMVYRYWASYSK